MMNISDLVAIDIINFTICSYLEFDKELFGLGLTCKTVFKNIQKKYASKKGFSINEAIKYLKSEYLFFKVSVLDLNKPENIEDSLIHLNSLTKVVGGLEISVFNFDICYSGAILSFKTLNNFKKLKILRLSFDSFVEKHVLFDFPSLVEFYAHEFLCDKLELKSAKNLKKFQIYRTDLLKINIKIHELQSLVFLSLGGCDISRENAAYFQNASNLVTLEVIECGPEIESNEFINYFKNLKHLTISQKMDEEPDFTVTYLPPDLESLDFFNFYSYFKIETLNMINSLKKLRVLHIQSHSNLNFVFDLPYLVDLQIKHEY